MRLQKRKKSHITPGALLGDEIFAVAIKYTFYKFSYLMHKKYKFLSSFVAVAGVITTS